MPTPNRPQPINSKETGSGMTAAVPALKEPEKLSVTPAGEPEAVRMEVIVPSIVSCVVNVPTVGDVPVAAVPRYASPSNVRAMLTALGAT